MTEIKQTKYESSRSKVDSSSKELIPVTSKSQVSNSCSESEEDPDIGTLARIKGMILFSSAVVLYTFSALLIKVQMADYHISAQELLYYTSVMVLVLFYANIRSKGLDLLQISEGMLTPLFFRVAGGFFADVLLYMAFEYTSYSKAICIFFTNTLMIPFFARLLLKEPILKADVGAIIVGFVGMMLIV